MNVYSRNTFSPKLWKCPDWETLLIHKYEGVGIMVSALQSKDFFVIAWDDLSDDDMKRTNGFRAEKTYMDKYVANLL